jgi:thymidylate kinase
MIFRIALTGGPAGGKTTALPLIANNLRENGYDVYTVPEIPTLFHANGVLLKLEPPDYHLSLELAAFSVHYEMETSFWHLARCRQKPSIILTDRGLVDLKAYCASEEMWEKVTSSKGLMPESILKYYYDLVLHFETTANGAEEHFTNENNPARQCNPELARTLDKKTLNVWDGHPNRVILDNSTDFQNKVARAIKAINGHLGQAYAQHTT